MFWFTTVCQIEFIQSVLNEASRWSADTTVQVGNKSFRLICHLQKSRTLKQRCTRLSGLRYHWTASIVFGLFADISVQMNMRTGRELHTSATHLLILRDIIWNWRMQMMCNGLVRIRVSSDHSFFNLKIRKIRKRFLFSFFNLKNPRKNKNYAWFSVFTFRARKLIKRLEFSISACGRE